MEKGLHAYSVEELSQSCKHEIPEKFVHKNEYSQCKVNFVPCMDDNIIDFSLLKSLSSSELGKLQLALSQWGCFQAINHGMTSAFLDKVREVSRQFFALSLEEKQKYSREVNDWEGYGKDPGSLEHHSLDWNDRLYLTVFPEDQRKLKSWPEKPLEFSEIINEFTLKLREMYEVLLKAIARSLNLEENCFLREVGDPVTVGARFTFYPPCPNPESTLGLRPHADATTVTMLLQDKEVEGLQVQKDDQWFRVPVVPDALFINVGDLLEIISNGMLKSVVHRVVTNSERGRYSVAVFWYSDPAREVGPVTELITGDRPQMYKKVKHYETVFFDNYQLGKRSLHDARM